MLKTTLILTLNSLGKRSPKKDTFEYRNVIGEEVYKLHLLASITWLFSASITEIEVIWHYLLLKSKDYSANSKDGYFTPSTVKVLEVIYYILWAIEQVRTSRVMVPGTYVLVPSSNLTLI